MDYMNAWLSNKSVSVLLVYKILIQSHWLITLILPLILIHHSFLWLMWFQMRWYLSWTHDIGEKNTKRKRGPNRVRTGDLLICSQMLYHWAMDPCWGLLVYKSIFYLCDKKTHLQLTHRALANGSLQSALVLPACIYYTNFLIHTDFSLLDYHLASTWQVHKISGNF